MDSSLLTWLTNTSASPSCSRMVLTHPFCHHPPSAFALGGREVM
jgi:hypothetical protein